MNSKLIEGVAPVSFSLVLPAGWKHYRVDDGPLGEIRKQLRNTFPTDGDGGKFYRRLSAALVKSVKSLEAIGASDFYLPGLLKDGELIPLAASMVAIPIVIPDNGIPGLVARLGGAASEVEVMETTAGIQHICTSVENGEVESLGPGFSLNILSVIEVPGSVVPTALCFQFGILEPAEQGEEFTQMLSALFFAVIHSLRWHA